MIKSNLPVLLASRLLRMSDVIRDTGISRPTLTNLYYGNGKGINYDTLNKLCAYLDVTPGELLTFVEEEQV